MRTSSLAAVLLASATAHAEPAVNLAVSGSVDAGVIATSIATELARPVTPLAANEACHAPCLAIAVSGTAATVTFTTASGGTRQRTIELGADRAEWSQLVTLLAGNLVRDEASDLLADPPPVVEEVVAPPPPPPIVAPAIILAPPSVVKPERVSPIGFGLVPGASTDLFDLDRSHWISIGLVAGVSGNVHGLAMSGAVDVAHGVRGLQLSGAVAVAGELTGVQIAGAATVTDLSTGAQIAGAVTAATRSHVQIAGAVAAARRADLQIAGAVAAADVAHTQVAGAVTFARASDLQIAGGVAYTQRNDGFQLAPINIARRNQGVQLGVINIGGGPDGDSFGLINIVPGGRTDVEASVDSNAIGTVMLRHGGKHFHNVYGFGGQNTSETAGAPNNDVWMYGLGVGPSFHIAGLPADLDAIAWHVSHGAHHESQLSLLNQLRLTIGVPVGPVTLVAGGAINVYVSDDNSSPFITARTTTPDPMNTDVTVKLWPSVFVGARI